MQAPSLPLEGSVFVSLGDARCCRELCLRGGGQPGSGVGRARGGASGAGVLGSAPWGPGASLTRGDFQKSDQVNTHIKTGDV